MAMATKDARLVNVRRLIFLFLALAYFFVYFHRLSLSVVADELAREFAASGASIGLLGSVYFYCYALMQFPAGILSDAVGPKKIIVSFLALASMGSVLFAFASSIEMAVFGRILVGLGVSMVFIPSMKIFSQWFKSNEFASVAGALNAVGGAGVLGGTWALALMAGHFGWRLSFVLIGVGTALISLLVWALVKDRPNERQRAIIFKPGAADKNGPPPMGWLGGARRVVSEKRFWPLAVWFFFDCGIFFGFGGLWSGPYLMDVHGMTRGEAGAVLSMIAWGMILGSPFLGFLSDRIVKSRKKIILACSLALAAQFFLLFMCPPHPPPALLYLFFFFFSVCSSSIVVIGFTTAKELFPVEIAGASLGSVNLFPFLGGAVFMPTLGNVLDAWPKTDGAYPTDAWSALIAILLASSLAAVACAFFIKETFVEKKS